MILYYIVNCDTDHDLDEKIDFYITIMHYRAQFENLNGDNFWTTMEPVAKAVSKAKFNKLMIFIISYTSKQFHPYC